MIHIFCLFVSLAAFAQSAGSFHVAQKLPQKGTYGWDYLAVDHELRHLYITRDTHVDIVDTKNLSFLATLSGTEGAHGIAVAPDLQRLFVTSGRTGMVHVFNRESLKPLAQIKAGDNPDSIVYDEKTHRVFAFNGKSQSATVIDTATNKVLNTIALDGKPEFAVTDGKGLIFDNIESKNKIAVIDATAMKVTRAISLSPCDSPGGLAMDREHRRLFATCDNKKLVVADADSGKVVATVAIGDGPDAVVFDPTENLVFVPNGRDGTLTVIHENSPDDYSVVQTVTTQKGARTLAFDEDLHRLFTVTAQFGEKPKPTKENPKGRPPIIDGSVTALVISR